MVVLREIEHLVTIARLFQELHIASYSKEPKELRKCHCTNPESCTRCEGLGVVVERGTIHTINPLPIQTEMRLKYPVDYSKFVDMYSLYLLYKDLMAQLQNFEQSIVICPTCRGTGEVTTSEFKNRMIQSHSCPTCRGSLFIVGRIENKKHTRESHQLPNKPPFHNG